MNVGNLQKRSPWNPGRLRPSSRDNSGRLGWEGLACVTVGLGVAAATLVVAAAVGLGARLAASDLLLGGTTRVGSRLGGDQLSHAASSLSASGIT
jgi:hypothetical protein